MLPSPSQQASISTSATRAIFIEKDAAYHHLLQTFTPTELASLVIVTSRGYADQACIRFLQLLADHMPVYAVCDADPHGVQIYLSLKYGTGTSATLPEMGRIDSLVWLDWYSSDSQPNVLPLKETDVRLALRLLHQLPGTHARVTESRVLYIHFMMLLYLSFS